MCKTDEFRLLRHIKMRVIHSITCQACTFARLLCVTVFFVFWSNVCVDKGGVKISIQHIVLPTGLSFVIRYYVHEGRHKCVFPSPDYL